MKPPAIGYLRSDVSGARKVWDQVQIRAVSARLGYRLIKTIEFSQHTDDPLAQLLSTIARDEVDAVVTPSAEHLGGEIPESLISAADVVIVSPEEAHSRRLANLFDPPSSTSEGDLRGDSDSRARDRAAGARSLAGRRFDPPLT
ncbi:hypothetical protein ACFWPK_04220 [Nocardia sp. NPDC058519]|uniref:hypothetical protein n=1 Tax=Nocardia sp. NPDC058519 TaxID=3346535 RepID=UPI0036515C8C